MRSVAELVPYILQSVAKVSSASATPLKLQKLLYYVQAWSLVFRDEALFREDLEAWIHGPAISKVYRDYKRYQWNYIPVPETTVVLSSSEREVIAAVVSTYGAINGKNLEALTHTELPWKKARFGLKSNQRSNNKISHQDMKAYYRKFAQSYKPFKISKAATELKTQKESQNSVDNFCKGIGSVLQLFPSSSNEKPQSSLGMPLRSSASDAEAIASDWERVGSYIWAAYEETAESSQGKHE